MRIRFPLFSLLLLTLAAGCVPTDPLDWKVSAKTPNHYEEWRGSDFRRLPPEVRAEFDRTFNRFAILTPGGATTDQMDRENALCRRIHGRTVRSILLEGYQLETSALLSRVSNTTDNMLRTVELASRATSRSAEQQLTQARETQAAAIDKMNTRLREIQSRTRQLERVAPR